MGVHAGLEICKVLQPVLDTLDTTTAVIGEVTTKTLSGLQDKLTDGEFYVVLSPEDALRSVKNRNIHAQEEQHNVMLTLVASVSSQADINDLASLESFLEQLDVVHHAVFGEQITLPNPFGQAIWPNQSIEVPVDEELRQFSLRIRQLQYPFTATRFGK